MKGFAMAMPFTTPLSGRSPKPGVATSDNAGTLEQRPSQSERGLQEPPQNKQPRRLWEKIKDAFDYGNAGDAG